MRRLLTLALIAAAPAATAGPAAVPEYRVKAAFLYNFAQFAEWPATSRPDFVLCTYGGDPFGSDLDAVKGQPVGTRTLRLQRRVGAQDLAGCHLLYVSREAVGELPSLRQQLDGLPVLLVTDSPGAARAGAALNMSLTQGRVTFEANRSAARAAGIELSSRLLRLATEVLP